jgi:hypothetical protein
MKAQLHPSVPNDDVLVEPESRVALTSNEVDRPEIVKEKANVDSIRQLRAQMILNIFNDSNDNA